MCFIFVLRAFLNKKKILCTFYLIITTDNYYLCLSVKIVPNSRLLWKTFKATLQCALSKIKCKIDVLYSSNNEMSKFGYIKKLEVEYQLLTLLQMEDFFKIYFSQSYYKKS